ncbi:unnamed protein product [Merluccius merluccius]
MILELLVQDQPDQEAIGRQLERFKAPSPSSSAHKPKRDIKIERTVSCFQELVDTLLRDPAERLQFFQEEFQEEYGATFDQELEKLLWEFLIRLDQLLPVPNLAQTVSWLSAAPPVLEECAQAATQPQLLKTILQYQTCLGHLEPAASLPPKMGDSILTSLSLPPSGKPPPPPPSAGRGTQATENKTPFIAPVIGRILNEDVPAMISASKKRAKEEEEEQQEEEQQQEEKEEEQEEEKEEEGSKRSNRGKRKQPDDSEEEEGADAQEEEMPVGRGASKGRRRKRRSLKKRRRESGSQSLSEDGASDPDPAGPPSGGASPAADPALRAAFSSCLLHQPTVLLRRLDAAAPGTAPGVSPGAANTNANVEAARSEPDSDDDGGGERERSAGVRPKKTDHPTQGDDIIGDSEDEATKNFKVRLFAKRYRKTKHDTYVPTLREFWKPWMARPGLLSPR